MLCNKHPNSVLVNDLPYIDIVDGSFKTKVKALLKQEMSVMPKIDYLADRPMPLTKFLTPEMETQFKAGNAPKTVLVFSSDPRAKLISLINE